MLGLGDAGFVLFLDFLTQNQSKECCCLVDPDVRDVFWVSRARPLLKYLLDFLEMQCRGLVLGISLCSK